MYADNYYKSNTRMSGNYMAHAPSIYNKGQESEKELISKYLQSQNTDNHSSEPFEIELMRVLNEAINRPVKEIRKRLRIQKEVKSFVEAHR